MCLITKTPLSLPPPLPPPTSQLPSPHPPPPSPTPPSHTKKNRLYRTNLFLIRCGDSWLAEMVQCAWPISMEAASGWWIWGTGSEVVCSFSLLTRCYINCCNWKCCIDWININIQAWRPRCCWWHWCVLQHSFIIMKRSHYHMMI